MKTDATGKVVRRLIPWLFLCYILNYLDRFNLSFAAMTLKADLGLSDRAYGLGAGIFFIGYVFLEVPSNLALQKVGPRRWIARIMVSWGLVSASMMFMKSAGMFYALRFLLGACEAGFFPGMVFMLAHWVPEKDRARAFALFLTSTSLAGVFGAPLSAGLLKLEGLAGFHGWQWLFLLEGLPTVFLGTATWFYLDDKPQDAAWLTAEEKQDLERELSKERNTGAHLSSLREGLSNGRVWHLGFLYFSIIISFYGVAFWLPQIVKNFSGLSNIASNLLSALPYVCASIGMVWVARHSDSTGERRWHVAIPAFASAAGLLAGAFFSTAHPLAAFLALCLTATGIWSTLGPFWAVPPTFLRGTAAAAGIALVNSLGNAGGFVGPNLVGYVKEATGHFEGGLLLLSGTLVVAGFLALTLPYQNK